LLDPSFDPYAWLWGELTAHANFVSLSAGAAWLLDPAQRTNLALLIVGVAGLLILWRGSGKAATHQQRSDDVDIARPSNPALWRRLWWRVRPPHDLMCVDGLVIDRSRKPHAAWLGPTGSGKSASVATVRVNGERPTLCAIPDKSDPLLAATGRLGGFVW